MAWHLTSEDAVDAAVEAEGKVGRSGKSTGNQLLLSLAQNGLEEFKLRKVSYDEVEVPEGDAKAQADSKRQAYFRARAWAIKKGIFEIAEGYVLMLKGAAP